MPIIEEYKFYNVCSESKIHAQTIERAEQKSAQNGSRYNSVNLKLL
jgi:hypothetical protein